MYLKYKYTYENAAFCILCIGDFKILNIFNVKCQNLNNCTVPYLTRICYRLYHRSQRVVGIRKFALSFGSIEIELAIPFHVVVFFVLQTGLELYK